MHHDVWVEPGKVSQQFGKVVQYESGELDDVTMTVLFQSPIGTGLAWSLPGNYRRTATELMNLGVCLPVGRSLNQQAVTV
jgi:hypothetical protein